MARIRDDIPVNEKAKNSIGSKLIRTAILTVRGISIRFSAPPHNGGVAKALLALRDQVNRMVPNACYPKKWYGPAAARLRVVNE